MHYEFHKIRRLPPYVFEAVNKLKAQERAKGVDIIDFGMGNPDQPTPQHIVDKLVEAAQREDTHRYSMSKGIPRLRRAISRAPASSASTPISRAPRETISKSSLSS